jgi:hypothetical protein
MLFNPNVIRALVYAGLVSNFLAIMVCFLFKEWDSVKSNAFDMLLWTTCYVIHKKRGTW